MILNLIWDVDGTIFDTYPSFSKAFKLAINDLGQDVPLEWITTQAKVSLDFCVEALAERCQLSVDSISEKFNYFYSRFTPRDQPPFDGVIEICKFITTSGGKNLIITHRHKAGLIRLLDTYDMRQFFSGWATADDSYKKKPDPEAFLATIVSYKLNPEETLTVGDRDIDILAGQAAGIRACFFGDPPSTCQPELVIQDFHQLLDWLKSSKS